MLNLKKRHYLPYYWSDKGFNGSVVNQTLSFFHGGSLNLDYAYSPLQEIKTDSVIWQISQPQKSVSDMRSAIFQFLFIFYNSFSFNTFFFWRFYSVSRCLNHSFSFIKSIIKQNIEKG